MSTPAGSNVGVPYIAPWAAQFNRYSTQIRSAPGGPITYTVATVPDGQWWRLLWIFFPFVTNNTTGNRVIALQTVSPGTVVVDFPAAAVQAPLISGQYTWGIGLNSFATAATSAVQYFQSSLVDVLWEPTTVLRVSGAGFASGEGPSQVSYAVEIYTEFQPDVSASSLILVPSPVLT